MSCAGPSLAAAVYAVAGVFIVTNLWVVIRWYLWGRRAYRAKLPKSVAVTVASRVELLHTRLRLRRRTVMPYSYGDLDDQPYVQPGAKPTAVNKHVRELAERKPELVDKLRAVARQLGRERIGGITAADVWDALDAETKAQANSEGRIMGAVFSKSEWMKTGEWRKLGSHGRDQPVWVLKAAQRPALKLVGTE